MSTAATGPRRRVRAAGLAVARSGSALATRGADRMHMWLLGQRWFNSFLLPALPRPVRWILRKAYFLPFDIVDRLINGATSSAPPRSATFTGGVNDFGESGEALMEALRDVAGLTPSSHVLDIGCGLGRLAIPLTQFLGPDGRYEGIDIVPNGITWCTQNIRSEHDNVHFTLADVRNKEYNPRGTYAAAEYKLPYGDDAFDVIVLISVFTHMLPDEVDNYLGEISRVLRPGGRCYITYFLLNDESRRLMALPGTAVRFRHRLDGYWTTSARVPELAIGYEEDVIAALYAKHGLAIDQIYRGAWCGATGHWTRESGLGGQDTVVAGPA